MQLPIQKNTQHAETTQRSCHDKWCLEWQGKLNLKCENNV